jgi:hypothetical protein
MVLPSTRWSSIEKIILRIELWHLHLEHPAVSSVRKGIEPGALLAGGLFMALNFFLLSFGVAWILTPLAGKGRVKTGVALLALKIVLFLGLLTLVFFKLDIDAISFALGFSSLLLAIVFETLRSKFQLVT